jgi:hypothetical protein
MLALNLGLGGMFNPMDPERLSLLMESSDLPKKTIQQAEGMLKGVKVKQGGIADFGNTIPFTFLELIDNSVTDALEAWSNLVFMSKEDSESDSGSAGWGTSVGPTYASEGGYKIDIPIYLLNGRKERTKGYLLIGAFYEDSDPGGTLSGEASDFQKPVLTLSFDSWTPIRVS